LARIAGAMKRAGEKVTLWDANLEGLLHLMGRSRDPAQGSPSPARGSCAGADSPPAPTVDTWTRRARRDLSVHLVDLRSGSAFCHPDTYRRVVNDLNRLLTKAPFRNSIDGKSGDNAGSQASHTWRVSLTDLESSVWSPSRSDDLARAADQPEANPFFGFFANELSRRIERDQPRVIGFSLNYLSQALTAFAMAGLVRRLAPAIRLVVGGSLITSWAAAHGVPSVARERFDLVVPGPGEPAVVEFCRHVAGAADIDGTGVAGGAVLADLPEPEYGLFPLAEYLSPGLALPFAGADGCFWSNCAFCPEKAEGGVYRPLPTDRGWEMVSRQIGLHQPRLLHFCESAMSPAWMKKLVQRLSGNDGQNPGSRHPQGTRKRCWDG